MPFIEAYLNLEEKDSASIRLKVAEKFNSKQNREKQDTIYTGQLTKS
jgi:hypothetical protein